MSLTAGAQLRALEYCVFSSLRFWELCVVLRGSIASKTCATNPAVQGATMDSNLNQNFSSADRRMVAFFDNEEQAYKAVSDLHNAGFNSEEIGLITRGGQFAATRPSSTSSPTERDSYTSGSATNDESVWEKIKHFFSGDEPQNEPDR